ncbi:MAG: histidine ammonia-lyase [Acidobacteriota bacterium]
MLEITGHGLRLEDFAAIVRDGEGCRLGDDARTAMERACRVIGRAAAGGGAVYGVNTGFGDLARVRIPSEQLSSLQARLLLSHAAGIGEALPDEAIRGMLLLRSSTLAQGNSGIRPRVVESLLTLLDKDILPTVPSRGSVGASGDLAPLSHLALPIIGRGQVHLGERAVGGPDSAPMPASEGLRLAGLEPLDLGPKEGLALINGTQAMTSLLALAVLDARRLARIADLVGALATDALRGTDSAFDARIHALRPHPGQGASAGNLWRLLAGSEIRESHRGESDLRVQDPYSVRCMPQVHGAARDLLADIAAKVEIEMNSVTDNPLVFAADDEAAGEIISGGNFHGAPMAMAADVLAMAVTELASISERRTEKLTNTAFSGLPPFLVRDAGLNSGFMIAQVTAAALVSENKTLCHPASVDSIPTSADKEDHVSMGMWAALKARQAVDNARKVLAIELVSAAQGIDLLRPLRSSEPLESLHRLVRQRVERWDEDREMAPDLAAAEDLLRGPDLDPLLGDLA